MLNAGIDMNFVPLATSLAVAEDGTLLLDPTSAEEKAAKATSVRHRDEQHPTVRDRGHSSCKGRVPSGSCASSEAGCFSSSPRFTPGLETLLIPLTGRRPSACALQVMTCSSVDVDGLVSSCTLGPLQPAQLLTCMDLAKGCVTIH